VLTYTADAAIHYIARFGDFLHNIVEFDLPFFNGKCRTGQNEPSFYFFHHPFPLQKSQSFYSINNIQGIGHKHVGRPKKCKKLFYEKSV
jgi:hypothetical protein